MCPVVNSQSLLPQGGNEDDNNEEGEQIVQESIYNPITPEMTEDMKNSSGSASTTSCRALTMQSGTMLSTPTGSGQPATSNQPALLPDTSTNITRRMNPKDITNADFVNRLLAASRITDFYSANIAPHTFFYSEMLRSLVQSRNEPGAEPSHQQSSSAPYTNSLPLSFSPRRNRKRVWTNRFSELQAEGTENNPLCNSEIEMKLAKIRKRDDRELYPEEKKSGTEHKTKNPLAASTEKSPNVMFPHTGSWYPPYPPFFIDLRVSGHVFDNNNDNKSKTSPPIVPTNGLDPKARHGSAFTVPPSRSLVGAMNLSTNQDSNLSMFKERLPDDNNNQRDDFGAKDSAEGGGNNNLRFEVPSEEVIAVDDAES